MMQSLFTRFKPVGFPSSKQVVQRIERLLLRWDRADARRRKAKAGFGRGWRFGTIFLVGFKQNQREPIILSKTAILTYHWPNVAKGVDLGFGIYTQVGIKRFAPKRRIDSCFPSMTHPWADVAVKRDSPGARSTEAKQEQQEEAFISGLHATRTRRMCW